MRFLTLFPKCENVHLIKDVGMVPFILHKEYNHDTTIGCYENGKYPYLDNDVKGLKLRFMKRVFNNTKLDSLLFLFLNFRRYDALQVYHFSIESLLYLTFFKILKMFNTDAKTYLKLDADDDILKLQLKGIAGTLGRYLIAKIGLISVETKLLFSELIDRKLFNKNLQYIPNGFYDNKIRREIDYKHKKNVFLTVGRIGTYQKSNEVLIEAFKKFCEFDDIWKLELIGNVESSFLIFMDEFLIENPKLRSRIELIGPIYDRESLIKKYDYAKVFVLSSRYESFGLVYLEAMSAGCTIISTAITPAYDVTENGKYGRLFPIDDVDSLAKVMKDVSSDASYLESNCDSIQKYAYHNFYWPTIIKEIDQFLTQKKY